MKKKRVLTVVLVSMIVSFSSACVVTPYYGGTGSYYSHRYVAPASQIGYYGFNNEPIMFANPYPAYGAVYDPLLGLGSAVVQGVGWGLGFGLIHGLWGGHHHHH